MEEEALTTLATPRPAEAPVAEEGLPGKDPVKRNFLCLVAIRCVQGWGWTFKTESLVVPAAAMALNASPFMLGLLPVLSQGMQTLPQVFAAGAMDAARQKNLTQIMTSVAFATLWTLIGLTFILGPAAGLSTPDAILAVFTVLYGVGHLVTSLNGLAGAALVGKVMPARLRGRLEGIAGMACSVGAVILVAAVIKPVLNCNLEGRFKYGVLFLATGALYFASLPLLKMLAEKPSASTHPARPTRQLLRHAWHMLRTDTNYAKAVGIQCCQMVTYCMIMFYTSLGRTVLDQQRFDSLAWLFLTCQIGTLAAMSLVCGALADRYGNRLVLRLMSMVAAAAPVTALGAAELARAWAPAYGLAYVLIGLGLPWGFCTVNYLLELGPPGQHAIYVGLSKTLTLVVVVVSLSMGIVVNYLGHTPLFCMISALMLVAVWLSFSIKEPRRQRQKIS